MMYLFSIFLSYVVHLRVFSNCNKSPKSFPINLLKKICISVGLSISNLCCSRDNCTTTLFDLTSVSPVASSYRMGTRQKHLSTVGPLVFLTNQPKCWLCGQLPLCSSPRLPWWVSPLLVGNWKALKQYIKKEWAGTSNFNSSDITNTYPETWPVAYAVNNTGYWYPFCQTTQAAHQIAHQNGPRNITIRAMVAIPDLEWVS